MDKLSDEEGRLAALARYNLTETGEEPAFKRITEVVRLTLGVPMAAVTIIDRNRQIFKAAEGLAATPTPRNEAFCDHTIRASRPMVVADATRDPRFAENPNVTAGAQIRSYLGIPLHTPDGYNLGSLCALDSHVRSFTPREIEIMQALARLVAEQIELRQIAEQDSMTGALTRRGFIAEMEKDFARARRYDRPSALLVLDIDNFKAINDAHGHPAGDAVVIAVARACMQSMRASDAFGRIGGEEFAMLLPETDAGDALACAERIRQLIAELTVDTSAGPLSVTASFGVAAMGPAITGPEQWFSEADIALYEAKRYGRNRCILAKPRRPAVTADGTETLPGDGKLH
ncbi:sensor domain-containing diguanylate cyclase [Arsenicitalea aurantiaca]|uniref:diguanylate cyclase n=1 Tax=Arsenicitalea aurantiaca TaxID=1783274 RepID=A0A433XG29_9HYPH|nr:sensor domain-containing diguanylate cyclase [Arsenicitalea aurantiaca]RUT33035.1 sensor domain-containing diguanylate cyclase [Arsenicitalea aurantiaca]